MTDLLILADRVEKAEGADRVLDYEIRAAVRGAPLSGKIVKVTHQGWETVHYENGGVSQGSMPRAYTASLDAASTLFPPGTLCRSGHSAIAPDPSMFFCDAVLPSGQDVHALAKTEPLARTAASLRARHAAGEG